VINNQDTVSHKTAFEYKQWEEKKLLGGSYGKNIFIPSPDLFAGKQ